MPNNFLSKNFALFFVGFFIQVFFSLLLSQSFAESYVSTNDVIKEIEKTLLFDKESREKMDFYQQKKSRKSDITILKNSEDSEQNNGSAAVDILVVDPKFTNFDIREKEKLAYNLALIGQYEAAIELYKQVLAAEPENVYSKFSLAVVYQKISQFSQAKSLYYELLKSDPSNKEEVIGNLLAILIEESPKDAVYLLSRLAIQNPNSPYILAQTANAYDKMKNYNQAINFLKKAIFLDPDNFNYKYNLSIIYDKTAQYEKALELYNEVAKNYPDDSNQSVSLDQIQKRIKFIKSKL